MVLILKDKYRQESRRDVALDIAEMSASWSESSLTECTLPVRARDPFTRLCQQANHKLYRLTLFSVHFRPFHNPHGLANSLLFLCDFKLRASERKYSSD